jgi:hypothetical protein
MKKFSTIPTHTQDKWRSVEITRLGEVTLIERELKAMYLGNMGNRSQCLKTLFKEEGTKRLHRLI